MDNTNNVGVGNNTPSKKQVIKIVDTSKTYLNILKSTPSEVTALINEIIQSADKETRMMLINYRLSAMTQLVQKVQTRNLYSRVIYIDDEITTLREIFTNDNILPVIGVRGNDVLKERHDRKKYIYSKAKYRKSATDLNLSSQYLAQNEPFQVIGILVSKNYIRRPMEGRILDRFDKIYNIPIFAAKTAATFGGQKFNKLAKVLKYQAVDITESDVIINKLVRQLNYIRAFNNGPVFYELVNETNSAIAKFKEEKINTPHQNTSNNILKIINDPQYFTTEDMMQIIVGLIQKLVDKKLLFAELLQYKSLDYADIMYFIAIQTIGGYLVLNEAISHGLNSMEVEKKINGLVMMFEQEKTTRSMYANYIKTISKIGRYTNIIIKKFGIQRLIEIYQAMLTNGTASIKTDTGGSMASMVEIIRVNNLEFIMDVLKPNEQEIVTSEYDLENELMEAERKNKCQHLKLVYNLRHATTLSDSLHYISKITELAVDPTSIEWLTCKMCNFKLICSHVLIMAKMTAESVPFNKIAQTLHPYFASMADTEVKAQTILAIEPKSVNFCKYCFEKINSVFPDRVVLSNAGLLGGTGTFLISKIWGMSFTFFKYIIFSSPMNSKAFANNVAATVNYYIVADNETDIRWKKNIMNEIIDNSTMIHIALYIAAYLMEMIRVSRLSDVKITLEGMNENAPYPVILEKLIDIINNEFRGIISKVTDMSLDYMKSTIRRVFNSIMTNSEITINRYDPIIELIDMITSYDYAFMYSFTMARICKAIPTEIKTAEKIKHTVRTVLGKDLEEIIANSKKIMANPKYKNLYSRGAGVKVPVGSSLKYLYKDTEINFHSGLFTLPDNKYISAAIDDYMSGNCKSSNFTIGAYYQSYKLFCMYTKNITSVENEEEYFAELEKYRKNEKYLEKDRYIRGCYPTMEKNMPGEYRPYVENTRDINITHIYDENGNRHSWGKDATYYYKNGNNIVEYKGISEISKAHIENKIKDSVLIDVGCGKCGCKKSDTNNLNKEKTLDAIKLASRIAPFYEFYSSRCPAGEFHEWADDRCKTCGLNKSLHNDILASRIHIKDDKGAVEYYNKYSAKYTTDLSERSKTVVNKINILNRDVAKERANKRDKIDSEIIDKIKKWAPDFTPVAKCAVIAKTSTELLKAMGSVDGRRYGDVLEGKDVPDPPTKRDDSRIHIADAELRLAVASFNIFINADYNKRLNPKYYLAFEKHKINHAEVMEFVLSLNKTNLAGMGTNYTRMSGLARWHLAPEVVLDYIVELFCRFVIDIHDIANDKKNIFKIFAETTIQIMIQNQRVFAMPEKVDIIIDDDENNELLNGDDQGDDD